MAKSKHVLLTALVFFLLTVHASASLYDIGNGLIYDDHLNVTWLQDANYAMTSGTDPFGSIDGAMDFPSASAWASGLDFAGYQDWRLPEQTELMDLGRVYHKISSDTPGDFINVLPEWYWTTTSGGAGKRRLYHFQGGGVQTAFEAYDSGYVLPLRDGPSGGPQPDIKANGSDSAIQVTEGTPVSISISLYAGTAFGQMADLWLIVATSYGAPNNLLSYVYPNWMQGLHPVLNAPIGLIHFQNFEVLNMALPKGGYTFCFGEDTTADGLLTFDQTLSYDCVSVSVN
jgi:hypothetical protein